MSDLFSQIGKAAQRVASNVTNEVSIAASEQRVSDAYRDLGRLYFETVQRGESPEGERFDALTRKISGLLTQIKEKRRSQKVTDEDFEDL